MSKFSLLIFFSFSFLIFGQKKFSTNEIMNSFPFNEATKVKIISYNVDFLSEFPIPLPPIKDSAVIKEIIKNQKKAIQLKNILGKEDLEGINQTKTLTFKEIFELSKLLYNTCGKFPTGLRRINKCFFPRNAILFYDKNDKVLEIFEICFECNRSQFTSKKSLEINDMCDNFYFKIEEFFKNNGFQTQHKMNIYEKK